ncbi:hypothetical protein Tdes44962_MAKER08809 [Teratosphaeria destructans]|uniref:Uncharacterized protein n=1 Tax=Teratosphaeria destructans TaxID=418781 RepID=A0A9W7SVP8_9PEZI|nr:hypothetical protein Tdes44962_MAKER08809 [Teratosphaeria destructans]
MDASPLKKLSAELRNAIYELVLTQDRPINLSVIKEKKVKGLAKEKYNNRRIPSTFLALTTTCRAIRADTRHMFYFVNDFIVGRQGMNVIPAHARTPFRNIRAATKEHMNCIHSFLDQIGTENATAIRRITFRLDIGIHPYGIFGDLKAVGRALIAQLRALAEEIPFRHAGVTLVFGPVGRWSGGSKFLTERTVFFASEAADWSKILSSKLKGKAMLSGHHQDILDFAEEMREQAEARAVGD